VEFSIRPVLFSREKSAARHDAKIEGTLCALHDVLKINYSRGFVNALQLLRAGVHENAFFT